MIKNVYLSLGVIAITLYFSAYAQAQERFFDFMPQQNRVNGFVTDERGKPVSNALISIKGSNFQILTDTIGFFETKDLNKGHYVFEVQYPNHRSTYKMVLVEDNQPTNIDLQLVSDGLQWHEDVQTGNFSPVQQYRSSNTGYKSTTQDINLFEALGSQTAGFFTQQTTIQGNNTGISRGILNTLNTTTFNTTILENRLPITTTTFLQFSPDYFANNSLSVASGELLNTDNAAIFSPLATGNIFQINNQLINEQIQREFRLTTYLYENGQAFNRWDMGIQGTIQPNLKYALTGFAKADQGIRTNDFTTPNLGGQLDGRLIYEHQRGYIQLSSKLLKDRLTTPNSTMLSQLNMDDITTFEETELANTSLTPNLQAAVTDGENWSAENTDASRVINTANQTELSHYNTTLAFGQLLGEGLWLENQVKYSHVDVQSTFLDNPLVLNTNTGAARFLGLPPVGALGQPTHFYQNNFRYTLAGTENVVQDRSMGIQQLGRHFLVQEVNQSNYDVNEWMNQMTLTKTFNNHQITAGGFYSKSNITIGNTGDHLASTLDGNAQPLNITHDNPFVGVHPFVSVSDTALHFTDANGFLGHGTGEYLRMNAEVKTTSFFANYEAAITDKLNVNLGWRYNSIQHKGERQRFFPANDRFGGTGQGPVNLATGQLYFDPISNTMLAYDLGADLNYQTFYDASTKIGVEQWDTIDFRYQFSAYSIGAQYQINKNIGVHSNFSTTQRTPDLGYYTQHFTNVEIEQGQNEFITSASLGTRLQYKGFALGITGFYTQMDSVQLQRSFEGQRYRSVQIPTLLNSIQTYGVEIEGFVKVNLNMDIRFNATFQNPMFKQLTYYNIAGTPDKLGDDFTEDLSGNTVANLPKFWMSVTPTYRHKWLTLFATASYVGERQANLRNSVQLPAYTQFNIGAEANFDKITIGLQIFNVNNANGIVRYTSTGVKNISIDDVAYGGVETESGHTIPRTDLTKLESDGQPFFAQTILPRHFRLMIGYRF